MGILVINIYKPTWQTMGPHPVPSFLVLDPPELPSAEGRWGSYSLGAMTREEMWRVSRNRAVFSRQNGDVSKNNTGIEFIYDTRWCPPNIVFIGLQTPWKLVRYVTYKP